MVLEKCSYQRRIRSNVDISHDSVPFMLANRGRHFIYFFMIVIDIVLIG